MKTRVREALHLDDNEFVEARAAAEAVPLHTSPARKPLGWGRAMLDYLDDEAPVDLKNLPNQWPALLASSATVHTLATAYDDAADDVEILLATLAQLAPFADAVKAQVA